MMTLQMTQAKKDALEGMRNTAAQIVFEYQGWTSEHVEEFYKITPKAERRYYTFDVLCDACRILQTMVDQGKSEQAIDYWINTGKTLPEGE
jgi:hypothetical protein